MLDLIATTQVNNKPLTWVVALVLFLVGVPLAFLSKAITRAPFFATRRESYQEERSEPARV